MSNLKLVLTVTVAVFATSGFAKPNGDEDSVHSWGGWASLIQPAAGPQSTTTTPTALSGADAPGFGAGDSQQFTARVTPLTVSTDDGEAKRLAARLERARQEASRVAGLASGELDVAKLETEKLAAVVRAANTAIKNANRAKSRAKKQLRAAKLAAAKANAAPKLFKQALNNLAIAKKQLSERKAIADKAVSALQKANLERVKAIDVFKSAGTARDKAVSSFKLAKQERNAAIKKFKAAAKSNKGDLVKLAKVVEEARVKFTKAKATKDAALKVLAKTKLEKNLKVSIFKKAKANKNNATKLLKKATAKVNRANKASIKAERAVKTTVLAAKQAKKKSDIAAANAKKQQRIAQREKAKRRTAKRAANKFTAVTVFPRKDSVSKDGKPSCKAGERCGYALTSLGTTSGKNTRLKPAALSLKIKEVSVVDTGAGTGDVVNWVAEDIEGKAITVNTVFDGNDAPSFAYGKGSANPNGETIDFFTGIVTSADYMDSLVGKVTANYQGFTLGSNASVDMKVNFGNSSWSGSINGGRNANGKVGFNAAGDIIGSNITSNSVSAIDGRVKGSLSGSFFGSEAGILAGGYDISKQVKGAREVVNERDLFVTADPTKVTGLPVVATPVVVNK